MNRFTVWKVITKITRSSAIHRETALQGGLVLAKVKDWNWETIFCGHHRSVFNQCEVISQQSNRIR